MSLATARMAELIAALEAELAIPRGTAESADAGALLPARLTQIGQLVLAESVRLIRVADRQELLDGGLALARALARPTGRQLADQDPGAHEMLTAASLVLGSASSPASSAGELAVLRSFGGKAREAVAHVSRAAGQTLPRSQLRALLGISDSYMSHLLAELESAGLVGRVPSGREVTVHLGPTAHGAEVRRQLPPEPARIPQLDPLHERGSSFTHGAGDAMGPGDSPVPRPMAVELVAAMAGGGAATSSNHPEDLNQERENASPPAQPPRDPVKSPRPASIRRPAVS